MIFGIIGIICAIVLVFSIIFLFGDDGQGGNSWIDIYEMIKEKICKH